MKEDNQKYEKSGTRLEALSDGMFAIIFTILVLELILRNVHFSNSTTYTHFLLELWPKFLSYILSFAILSTYWIGHVEQFHFTRRINRPFIFTNLLFLFFLSLIPFSTILISEFPQFPVSTRIYGVNLLCCQIAFALNLWCLRHHDLHTVLLNSKATKQYRKYLLIAFILDPLGIAATYINVPLSLAILGTVPVIYLVLFLLDRRPIGESYK
jgi:uncharacterized membrane protein